MISGIALKMQLQITSFRIKLCVIGIFEKLLHIPDLTADEIDRIGVYLKL